MLLFLVLFLNERPSIPLELSDIQSIEFGEHAYILASNKHTATDFVTAFEISTGTPNRRHGIVAQLDLFAGAAPRAIAEKIIEWRGNSDT